MNNKRIEALFVIFIWILKTGIKYKCVKYENKAVAPLNIRQRNVYE
jgi:hypothetical protein